ncbi:MAG: hypothetical protein K2K65_08795 [Duncaniella sp.]|nr:hypothetical protein [Duncaniella sp.]
MAKNYQISNNIIFSINEDGSITRIAEIGDDGKISGLQEKIRVIKEADKSVSLFMWIAIVIACVIGCLYYIANNVLDETTNQIAHLTQQIEQSDTIISSLQNQINSLIHEKDQAEKNLQSLRAKIGDSYPLIISDIEIANTDGNSNIETSYGQTIYSSRSMYLMPKISYVGIKPGIVTLYVKLIDPNGRLSIGNSSPSGYSYSSPVVIWDGNNNAILSGWGNSSKGNWAPGTYRLEVWYENVCLKSKTFTIY